MATLFHPRLLRDRLARHAFPADLDARRLRLTPWIDRLRNGQLAAAHETQLHGPFLQRVFGDVLGYRTWDHPASGFDLHHEVPVRGGKQVDGAIGWFGVGPDRIHAPIELKGASHPLDAAGSRVQTPVEQAWGYANRTAGCRWILVSNYRETRLYSTAHSMEDFESFLLDDLDQDAAFRRFWMLLSRDSLLPAAPGGRSYLDELLTASSKEQDEVTGKLYGDYQALRRDLFLRLARSHSNLPPLDVLRLTQKLLDRFLFVAFAEDRRLLPADTIKSALDHVDAYHPRPVWENLKAVFSWVDKGNPVRQFPPYNGGLFAEDAELDALDIDDEACRSLKEISRYDFGEDVSVEVLGHIFEQSISDLEELRAEASGQARGLSKRKAEGVFYTPAFVTRYIVEETLGRALDERFAAIQAEVRPEDVRGAKKQQEAWITVWIRYREGLRSLRVLDPACGSGAFLIAAFERLHREYVRVNASLAELRGGQRELFDLDKTILNQNLFGVDLNPESVEITKLSLWLKTAQRDKKLTWLDGNIRCGNSVVSDPRVHPRAVDWTGDRPHLLTFLGEFDEAEVTAIDERWREGFDVVIGNPPYVRQELLTAYKEHWKSTFTAYDGVADLYVYFFELGLNVLKPGGRLGFVVTNKWLKSGYAGPLRELLAGKTEVETVIDFGHAPIFPDADAFPSIVTMRKAPPAADRSVSVTRFPREELGTMTVPEYVNAHAQPVPQARFGREAWSLEGDRVERLMGKLRERGVPLAEYAGCKPLYGIKTGFNEAFLIDEATRGRLVREDASCSAVLQRFVGGGDIGRWASDWGGEYLITLASSENRHWPWTGAEDPERAFGATFPSLYGWLKPMEARLRARSDKGQYWWELRSCAYYSEFLKPKLLYQDIQFHARYAFDTTGLLSNNMAWLLPADDVWLAAVLNSPALWWHNFRFLQHGKDEALRPFRDRMLAVPIAPPSPEARTIAGDLVPTVVAAVAANHVARRGMVDALRLQYAVEKPGDALANFHRLDADSFVREIIKRRGKSTANLRPADIADLRGLHESESLPVIQREQDISRAERRLSDLVNTAYGLTEDEITTLRDTAPPRMPPGL